MPPNAQNLAAEAWRAVWHETARVRRASRMPVLPNAAQDIQPSLFDGQPLPPTGNGLVICAGECSCELPSNAMRLTPAGLMCEPCINDLYAECVDCGKFLRYDHWGECDDLRLGPDDKRRCQSCDRAVFSICTHCGRRTFRTDEVICTNPTNSDEEYCTPCWELYWLTCDACGDIVSHTACFSAPRGNMHYCEACFEQNYFQCSNCGRSFNRSDMCGWDGDPFCDRCFGNADTWKVQPWSGCATTFDLVGSKRCYGVELETERCDDYRSLHGNTEWGCVIECSTPGREFISPILQGDEGFAEIRKICDSASSLRWSVDRSCGLHVHIDARDLSSDEILHVAYAYRKSYPLWKKFVSSRRADNSMCGSPQYNPGDIRSAEHIEDFVEARDRFEFVNWRSYLCHGSIEIRLYDGSLNSREICNWVALHVRFIDAVKSLTFDEIDRIIGRITRINWRGLVELIDDSNLLDYWRRVAMRHGNRLAALWADEANTVTCEDSEESVYNEDRYGVGGDSSWSDRMGPPQPVRPFARPVRQPAEGHCGDEHCVMCNERYGDRRDDEGTDSVV